MPALRLRRRDRVGPADKVRYVAQNSNHFQRLPGVGFRPAGMGDEVADGQEGATYQSGRKPDSGPRTAPIRHVTIRAGRSLRADLSWFERRGGDSLPGPGASLWAPIDMRAVLDAADVEHAVVLENAIRHAVITAARHAPAFELEPQRLRQPVRLDRQGGCHELRYRGRDLVRQAFQRPNRRWR